LYDVSEKMKTFKSKSQTPVFPVLPHALQGQKHCPPLSTILPPPFPKQLMRFTSKLASACYEMYPTRHELSSISWELLGIYLHLAGELFETIRP
jgi:hypothetical protein